MEAERGEIEPRRRRRVVEAARRVGLDLRMRGRQPRLHHRRLGDREALEPAVGRGHRNRQLADSRPLRRGALQHVGERVLVEREGGGRHLLPRRLGLCGGGGRRGGGRDRQQPEHGRERRHAHDGNTPMRLTRPPNHRDLVARDRSPKVQDPPQLRAPRLDRCQAHPGAAVRRAAYLHRCERSLFTQGWFAWRQPAQAGGHVRRGATGGRIAPDGLAGDQRVRARARGDPRSRAGGDGEARLPAELGGARAGHGPVEDARRGDVQHDALRPGVDAGRGRAGRARRGLLHQHRQPGVARAGGGDAGGRAAARARRRRRA